MEVLPDAFGPTRRLTEGSSSSSSCRRQRRSSTCSPSKLMPVGASKAHRHNYKLDRAVARRADQAAAVGIGQADLNRIRIDRSQCLQQIGDVKPDFDFLTFKADLDLILRFLLLGVMRLYRQQVGREGQSDTAVFLVR